MTLQQNTSGWKATERFSAFSLVSQWQECLQFSEKSRLLVAQLRASGKNECRKLLCPLLHFALYFFPLEQQVHFFVWLVLGWMGGFFGVWSGFILWKEGPWRRGKNRLCSQLAQGDSNQSFVLLLSKASLRFPRKAGRSDCSHCRTEGPDAQESCCPGTRLRVKAPTVDRSSCSVEPGLLAPDNNKIF